MRLSKQVSRGLQLNLNITQELMDAAVKRDSSHCAIAEAVKVAVPAAKSIAVDVQTIRFSLPERRVRMTYLTPRIAQVAIIRWDQGIKPQPYSFRLRNAHVTSMGKHNGNRKLEHGKPLPENIVKANEVNPVLAKPKRELAHPELARQRLAENTSGDISGAVAQRMGGTPPPLTPFSRRRSFGLRALEL